MANSPCPAKPIMIMICSGLVARLAGKNGNTASNALAKLRTAISIDADKKAIIALLPLVWSFCLPASPSSLHEPHLARAMRHWHTKNHPAMAANQAWHKPVHMIEKGQLQKQCAWQNLDATTRIWMRIGKKAGANPFRPTRCQ